MKKLTIILLLTISNVSFASGGVMCEGKHGKSQIFLSWPTSRVVGNPRIGPYSLTIGKQKFLLDESKPTQNSLEGEFIEIKEVGYWLRQGKLFVNLADSQVMRSMILLHIDTVDEKAKSASRYMGPSFLEIYDPGVSRKLEMACSWDE